MWKRNNKSIETKHLLDVPQPGFHDLAIQEKLSSISTIIYQTDKRAFMGKESELVVIMLFEGSPKKLGYFHIDMKSILDPAQHQQARSELFDVPLTVTSPSNLTRDARISFRLTSTFKEEVSAVTGEKSVTGSLNMSGMSMPFDAKYLKCTPVPRQMTPPPRTTTQSPATTRDWCAIAPFPNGRRKTPLRSGVKKIAATTTVRVG